ncbi:MAG: GNAT family N-acyltransferase [Patescibacteria group bacterium]|nr:GNAT family N-acyltransferase [Patescibacteria group bacterium]
MNFSAKKIKNSKNPIVIFLLRAYLLFHLRRPYKQYKLIFVRDEENKELMERVYKFRYNIYCNVDGLLNKEEYPDKKETDLYDKYADHIIAFDRYNNIVGTSRIIKNSPLGFPTEKEFDLVKRLKNVPREKITELSRFMIHPDYRKTMLLLDMFKAIYLFSRQNDYLFWFGCAEKWFLKTLDNYVGEVELIGEPKFCFNAINYPFFIDIKKKADEVKEKDRLLFYFYNYKSNNFEF